MTNACEICGNTYDKMLTVIVDNVNHHYDCFECAIQGLAPMCSHCGVRIVGHGLEENDKFFCCAHCARAVGKQHFVDRVTEVRM